MSDPLGLTAHPYPFIPNKDPIPKIAALVAEYDVAEIILGWPLNLKGEATAACQKVADFQTILESEIGLPVHRVDERFTTQFAQRTLLEADISREKRKTLVDSQAAAFILAGYMDRHNYGSSTRR